MNRRYFTVGWLLMVVGSAGLLFAAGREWIVGTITETGLPVVHVSLGGHSVAPASAAFGLLGLAGAAAIVLTKGWWRRMLAGLLALIQMGAVALLLSRVVDPRGAVRLAGTGASGTVAGHITPWPYVAATCCGVLVVAGLLIVLATGIDPSALAYGAAAQGIDDPVGEPASAAASAGAAGDLWSTLESGHDPTV
ncbi:MAG: Trp biosynthesis-associated membrane protein [Actinomycetes bacterium]